MSRTLFIIGIILAFALRLSTSDNSNEGSTENEETEVQDVSHQQKSFDCSDQDPIIIQNLNSALSSLTLNSPCYERSSAECTATQNCTITIQNMPQNMWIGMFFNMSSSESHSRDKLTISTGNSNEQFESSLSDIKPGLFFRYNTAAQTNSLSLTLTTSDDTSTGSALPNSVRSPRNKFSLEIKFAHSFNTQKTLELSSNLNGFIVSHFAFDNTTDLRSNYPERLNEKIYFTTEANYVIRLTFLAFRLHRSYNLFYGFCDDYLQIYESLGEPIYFCGYDHPTGSYLEFYPNRKTIELQFVSRKSKLSRSTSTGFLIKFEGISPKSNDCPPSIQNAEQLEEHLDEESATNNGDVHIIKCQEGYRTSDNTFQIVNCSNDGWRSSILPCILIECGLPAISNSSKLNFTLSSTGRATVGTNITYSCNSERYELTEGNEISTCTSDGEWNSPVPNCTLKVQSTPPETTSTTIAQTTESSLTKTSRHALEGNSSTQASVQGTEAQSGTDRSVGGYIGAGVGVAIALSVVVVVILLMKKRRSRSQKHQGIAGSENLDNCQPNYPQSNGEIYSLADDGQSGDRTRTLPEVYELAGPIEVLDEQSSKIPSKSVSEKASAQKKPATADSAGVYVDLSASAGVYSLANEDETRIADQNGAPNATRNDEYELAGSIDNYELAGPTDNYENANAIERAKKEQDVSEDYGSVLADRKTNKSNLAADVMVDNELYGS